MKTILRMGLLLSLFISLHTPIQALEVKEVYTVDDWLSIDVGDTVLLMNDLDFDGVDYRPIPLFSGTLDGQGYTLRNIEILAEDSGLLEDVGLFGQLSNATVRNLKIDNMELVSKNPMVRMGSLAGRAELSDFENISINNTSLSSFDVVGGLVGHLINSNLSDVHIKSTNITGVNSIGGLIGKIEPLDTFSEVIESNTVSINMSSFQGSISGERQVGGLVGVVNLSTSISIRESFTKGSLNALESAGFMMGEIISSSVEFNDVYSKMDMTYTYDESFLGNFGWIGARMGDGSGTHSLILNRVYQQTSMQGLSAYENMHAWVGWDLDESNSMLSDIYYDHDRLSLDDIGMKTSEELLLKESYANFDFDTIWLIDTSLNDGHPLFQYEVFEVTIHPNNGDSSLVRNHTKNSSIILPELIYDGFTLEGWYQDETLTIPFDSIKTYSQDMALYAKWIENPADEVIIEEPVEEEPIIQGPSPVAPNPVQEVETNNVQSPVIVVNKPIIVTPVVDESSVTEDEPDTSEIITEPKDEEVEPPLDPVENKVSKAGSCCWLWLLLILLLTAYIIYRKLKKRKLVDNE